MREKDRDRQPTADEQLFIEKLHSERSESARILERPSMEGIKETVVEKYSEQAHFIYELLQNADDAAATKARFVLTRSGLIFAHNGTVRFSISDVNLERDDKREGKLGHINAITSIAQTAKSESEIGKFGIGFKSVFQYTNTPEIYDPPFYFKIERLIVPVQLSEDHKDRKNNETLFYFPFNLEGKKPEDAYTEITARLKDLNDPLLFLNNLNYIGWKNEELQWNYSREDEIKGKVKIVSSIYHESSQKHVTKFLIFEKFISSPKKTSKPLKINIGFKLSSKDSRKVDTTEKYSPFCFFETHEQSELRFIIQAPFVLNNSREGLKEKNPDNDYLIQNLAVLLEESLPSVRDLGYLSLEFFEVFPLPEKQYFTPSSLGKYKPFFDSILKILKSNEPLLPVHNGGHTNIKNAIIARGGREFIDILENDQLENLLGKKGIKWLDSGITDKNEKIWLFFTDHHYLGIRQIRPEEFISQLSKRFVEIQKDEWLITFYSYVLGIPSLWGSLKGKPFIRINIPKPNIKETEIDHVKPFDATKKPLAFLPIENESEKQYNDYFPTVKPTIIKDPRAKKLLVDIGLTHPDGFAAIGQVILSKYLKEGFGITEEEHITEIEKITGFLKIKRKDPGARDNLTGLQENMQNIPFLYATNCEGKREFVPPQKIYLPQEYTQDPNLELFFENNPDIWFLDPVYLTISDIDQLLGFLDISTKPIIFTITFQDDHTYRRGFTHDYVMEGLEFLLQQQTITLTKSLYLWNLLLQSQKDQKYKIELYGKFEYANDYQYKGANVGSEIKYTTVYRILTTSSWVPDREMNFYSPAYLSNLHEEFEKLSLQYPGESQKLYRELKFFSENPSWFDGIKDSIPEDKRDKIKIAMDLPVELLKEAQQKHLDNIRRSHSRASHLDKQSADPRQDLFQFFHRPQEKQPLESPAGGTVVTNPNRRRIGVIDEIATAKSQAPDDSERISFSYVKKWDGKNPETRTFLKEEYGGKCQICESTFIQRSGQPYFEGAYMISRIKGEWLDRPGSVLCLCPTCCAKILHGSIETKNDVVEQILGFKMEMEGGSGKLEIPIILCDKEEKIRFSEKHILDLQEILKAENQAPDRE